MLICILEVFLTMAINDPWSTLTFCVIIKIQGKTSNLWSIFGIVWAVVYMFYNVFMKNESFGGFYRWLTFVVGRFRSHARQRVEQVTQILFTNKTTLRFKPLFVRWTIFHASGGKNADCLTDCGTVIMKSTHYPFEIEIFLVTEGILLNAWINSCCCFILL